MDASRSFVTSFPRKWESSIVQLFWAPAFAGATAIKVYQFFSKGFAARCRFYPSCSEYMRQAILARGLNRGFWSGLRRLIRCHPWHPGGVDIP